MTCEEILGEIAEYVEPTVSRIADCRENIKEVLATGGYNQPAIDSARLLIESIYLILNIRQVADILEYMSNPEPDPLSIMVIQLGGGHNVGRLAIKGYFDFLQEVINGLVSTAEFHLLHAPPTELNQLHMTGLAAQAQLVQESGRELRDYADTHAMARGLLLPADQASMLVMSGWIAGNAVNMCSRRRLSIPEDTRADAIVLLLVALIEEIQAHKRPQAATTSAYPTMLIATATTMLGKARQLRQMSRLGEGQNRRRR